jgi:hypothetical protein
MAADDNINDTFRYHGPPNPRHLLERLKRKYSFAEAFHLDWMLNEIDMAAMWYHDLPDLPTHKQLLPAVQRAGRLAAELERALHAAWPLRLEPDGALEALRQIREEAVRQGALIEKRPPSPGRRTHLREWVARMMALYEQGTDHVAGYTWDEPASAYTGDFMGFVRAVAAAWGIEASDSAIVDQIKRHRRDPFLLDALRGARDEGQPD